MTLDEAIAILRQHNITGASVMRITRGRALEQELLAQVLDRCEQNEAELKEAKRLLKLAVEDLEKIAAVDECSFPYCDSRCPFECMGQCEEKHWKHTDEALKLIGGDDSESTN